MGTIRVIAGLGNPGPRYEKTRHNSGFMVLDALRERCEDSDDPLTDASGWRDKGSAALAEFRINGETIHGIKPQTYMNRSGDTIGELLRFYKIEASELLVVHDDIDLPLGRLRLKQGGGEAGHNGLRSISEVLGTRDYHRLRIGVGKPERCRQGLEEDEDAIAEYVLSRFSEEEENMLKGVLIKGVDAIFDLCLHGLENAQKRYNS